MHGGKEKSHGLGLLGMEWWEAGAEAEGRHI